MTRQGRTKELAGWVKTCIADFARSAANTLRNSTNDPAWADPLVGFAKGDDPIFEDFKKGIGTFYWTPLEIFSKTFPSAHVAADELTVISWILPHVKETRLEMRTERALPSERWARARLFGEEFNKKLRVHVVETLKEAGYEALAPVDSPEWKSEISQRWGFASRWSERHAAYAAGLGTFGLCDGLITPVGKAMRAGSVVARIHIPPTSRPYEDHHAYCLFFAKGACGKCMERCPAGAVTKEGHDKVKCRAYVDSTKEFVRSHFGLEIYACGLCQTGVPCEAGIPVKKLNAELP